MKMSRNTNNTVILTTILFLGSFILLTGGYVVIQERAYFVAANETINKDFVFTLRKINRTTLALDYSFVVVRNITDGQIIMHFEAFKLVGNEYKQMGAKMVVNGCEFLEKNTFGLDEQFKKHGYINLCKFTGKQYLKNFIPDMSKFPKFLPTGSFRVHISAYHQDVLMSHCYWYARIENR